MGIKDINEIINTPLSTRERLEKTQSDLLKSTLTNSWRKTQPPRKRFSERIKKIDPKYSAMQEVAPPLHREDFLRKWQEDRKELAKVREERDKYKKIINTKFSKDWPKIDDKEKT